MMSVEDVRSLIESSTLFIKCQKGGHLCPHGGTKNQGGQITKRGTVPPKGGHIATLDATKSQIPEKNYGMAWRFEEWPY